MQALGNPSNDFCPVAEHQLVCLTSRTSVHFVSVLVCCLCEYETLPLLLHSKAAVIEPDLWIPLTTLQASDMSHALSAALTASSPQQDLACLSMLPVN